MRGVTACVRINEEIRRQSGVRVIQLAREAGYTPQHITDMLRGRRRVTGRLEEAWGRLRVEELAGENARHLLEESSRPSDRLRAALARLTSFEAGRNTEAPR